jgi:hypothetical protein
MNCILEEKRLLVEERDKLKIESIKLDYTIKLNKTKANVQRYTQYYITITYADIFF